MLFLNLKNIGVNMKLIAIQDNYSPKDKWLRVEWNLGRRCNYDCSYCDPNIHNKNDKYPSLDIIRGAVGRISKFIQKNNRICRISLTGGEPFLHPEIFDILKIIKGAGIDRLSVTTNGSLPLDVYRRSLNYFNYLIFSYQPEYADRDRFLRLVESINNESETRRANGQKIDIHVHIMMLPGKFEELKNIMRFFDERDIKYVKRRIRPQYNKNGDFNRPFMRGSDGLSKRAGDHTENNDMIYYSKEELKYLNKKSTKVANFKNIFAYYYDGDGEIVERETNVNELLMREENSFEDWLCWAGLQSMTIDNNGDVWRGICRQGGKLGDIKNGFLLPNDPVVCKKKNCNCAAEIPISKALRGREKLLRVYNEK